jgi:mono/diheme cytochrome c family protein
MAGMILGLASLSAAIAQEPGNAARGRASAGRLCADCHWTGPGPGLSPLETAPPFGSVAKTKGMTAMALNVWLLSSHPTMPNILLTPDTTDDIIAYIVALRAGASPNPPTKNQRPEPGRR